MEKHSRKMIKRAEAAKATMYNIPGKDTHIKQSINELGRLSLNKEIRGGIFSVSDMFHSVLVDEKYTLAGAHLDSLTKKKIREGDYVDFARLVPRDRVLTQQDERIELVNVNGHPTFRPVSDCEIINNFNKWEQAFQVYSTIYTEAHPHKAKELIQYNHIIYSASLMFVWSNIYAYDISFRMHISENLGRNCGIILQQVWTMRLRERISQTSSKGNFDNSSKVNNASHG